VSSLVRLRASDGDARIAASWSIALAEAIATRLLEGGADVLRFGSRHQAIVEMLHDSARGELSRSWAWRQLGFWGAGDGDSPQTAVCAAMESLVRNPRATVAVLRAASEQGDLQALIRVVPGHTWLRLALAVLREHGGAHTTSHDSEPISPTAISRAATIAASIMRGSAIARAFVTGDVSSSAEATRAMAILALCEREPDRAARGDAEEILRALTMELTKRPIAAKAGRPAVAESLQAPRSDSSRESHPADERSRAYTAHGGLLFLLHIVGALELPRLVRDHDAFASRSLSWVLHRLALDLTSASPTDAAALAFAGLPPTVAAPSELEPPAGESEREALASLRSRIVASLRTRLRAEANESDEALLVRTISRRAEIVCDAAWIEAHFALADATIDVRRAGLDLDPDWIPWLGVVVRFVYE
jgi:hypothetical protein